jgi:exodeoxyribonuclease VII large subunit
MIQGSNRCPINNYMTEKKIYSLKEIAESIQRAVSQWYSRSYWIKAEMTKLNLYTHSGHCYPDLVEKEDDKVVAQMRATLWSNDFQRINQQFLEVTREPLKDGISILMNAMIRFHPVYGLSLEIHDIDPRFTLGELAKRKQETILKLKAEGIFERNKVLELPLLPQRIAVISVETSKGYADFLNEIEGNPWGYKFFHMLFPSLLQGDEAIKSIMGQLERVRKVKSHFDAVAIIRGGGGDVGLSCYDDFRLAKEVALFPIPVLTGIGHSTNETVVQMVAHRNTITPTALAQYLIQQFHNYVVPLRENQRLIIETGRQLVKDHKNNLLSQTRLFKSISAISLGDSTGSLIRMANQVFYQFREMVNIHAQALSNTLGIIRKMPLLILESQKAIISELVKSSEKSLSHQLMIESNKISGLENQVRALDPQNVLQRGFSITRKKGKALNQSKELKGGDLLETEFYDGKVTSIVQSKDDTA